MSKLDDFLSIGEEQEIETLEAFLGTSAPEDSLDSFLKIGEVEDLAPVPGSVRFFQQQEDIDLDVDLIALKQPEFLRSTLFAEPIIQDPSSGEAVLLETSLADEMKKNKATHAQIADFIEPIEGDETANNYLNVLKTWYRREPSEDAIISDLERDEFLLASGGGLFELLEKVVRGIKKTPGSAFGLITGMTSAESFVRAKFAQKPEEPLKIQSQLRAMKHFQDELIRIQGSSDRLAPVIGEIAQEAWKIVAAYTVPGFRAFTVKTAAGSVLRGAQAGFNYSVLDQILNPQAAADWARAVRNTMVLFSATDTAVERGIAPVVRRLAAWGGKALPETIAFQAANSLNDLSVITGKGVPITRIQVSPPGALPSISGRVLDNFGDILPIDPVNLRTHFIEAGKKGLGKVEDITGDILSRAGSGKVRLKSKGKRNPLLEDIFQSPGASEEMAKLTSQISTGGPLTSFQVSTAEVSGKTIDVTKGIIKPGFRAHGPVTTILAKGDAGFPVSRAMGAPDDITRDLVAAFDGTLSDEVIAKALADTTSMEFSPSNILTWISRRGFFGHPLAFDMQALYKNTEGGRKILTAMGKAHQAGLKAKNPVFKEIAEFAKEMQGSNWPVRRGVVKENIRAIVDGRAKAISPKAQAVANRVRVMLDGIEVKLIENPKFKPIKSEITEDVIKGYYPWVFEPEAIQQIVSRRGKFYEIFKKHLNKTGDDLDAAVKHFSSKDASPIPITGHIDYARHLKSVPDEILLPFPEDLKVYADRVLNRWAIATESGGNMGWSRDPKLLDEFIAEAMTEKFVHPKLGDSYKKGWSRFSGAEFDAANSTSRAVGSAIKAFEVVTKLTTMAVQNSVQTTQTTLPVMGLFPWIKGVRVGLKQVVSKEAREEFYKMGGILRGAIQDVLELNTMGQRSKVFVRRVMDTFGVTFTERMNQFIELGATDKFMDDVAKILSKPESKLQHIYRNVYGWNKRELIDTLKTYHNLTDDMIDSMAKTGKVSDDIKGYGMGMALMNGQMLPILGGVARMFGTHNVIGSAALLFKNFTYQMGKVTYGNVRKLVRGNPSNVLLQYLGLRVAVRPARALRMYMVGKTIEDEGFLEALGNDLASAGTWGIYGILFESASFSAKARYRSAAGPAVSDLFELVEFAGGLDEYGNLSISDKAKRLALKMNPLLRVGYSMLYMSDTEKLESRMRDMERRMRNNINWEQPRISAIPSAHGHQAREILRLLGGTIEDIDLDTKKPWKRLGNLIGSYMNQSDVLRPTLGQAFEYAMNVLTRDNLIDMLGDEKKYEDINMPGKFWSTKEWFLSELSPEQFTAIEEYKTLHEARRHVASWFVKASATMLTRELGEDAMGKSWNESDINRAMEKYSFWPSFKMYDSPEAYEKWRKDLLGIK